MNSPLERAEQAEAEPVAVTVTRYRCPFCSRGHWKHATATAHIERCWRNPAARACKTCAHYEPPQEGPYPEHPGWPEGCTTDRDLSDGLKTGCPLWQAIHPDPQEQP